jgi:hypothetical protein
MCVKPVADSEQENVIYTAIARTVHAQEFCMVSRIEQFAES